MEKELRFLRNKVQKLESTIEFIQNEVQDKLNLILERFFIHRVDQLTKQKRAIQLEEDICRNLLSCCRLAEDEGASEGHASDAGSPTLKPRKRKRKANRSSRNSTVEPGSSAQPQDQSGSENNDSLLEQSDPNLPSGNKLPIDSDRILESEDRDSDTSDVDEFRMAQVKMEIVDDTQANNGDQSQKGLIEDPDDPPKIKANKAKARLLSSTKRRCSSSKRNKSYKNAGKDLQPTDFQEYRKETKSPIWKYFLREATGRFAKCKIDNCGRILHNHRSTGILHTHLKGLHNIVLTKGNKVGVDDS